MLLVLLGSCGSTYNVKTAEIENDLMAGNFDGALARVDQNRFLKKDRNRLLFLMEKGKLEHLRGNYEASNTLFESAYIMIDDRIKTSVGQAIAAKFTNPMAEPYKGEDFEKVIIHYYKALNYAHLNMPNEALVEAKRINIKLDELNQKYNENKNKYSEDAFSLILTGILYECTGDINGAFIAYRNAYEIYERNGGSYYDVSVPEQLKQDLLRTSKQLGFTQEYIDYSKKFKEEAPKTVPTGEAIIFWENGLGPVKDQIVITASGGGGVFYGTWQDGNVVEEILIPIPVGTDVGSINAIAIPKYTRRDNYYTGATLAFNNAEHSFELAEDFYPIAKQCLRDRMLRETINLVLRFATKKAGSAILGEIVGQVAGDVAGDVTKLAGDVAGAATEQADTRNWQSLPQTISYLRVPLSETGENKFVMKKYGPYGVDTDTINIPYKKGLQIINYFDLSRAQPQPLAQATTLATTNTDNGSYYKTENIVTDSAPVTPASVEPMDKAIEEKYNKWSEPSNGISYRVTYEISSMQGQDYYVKKVWLKSSNPEKVKVKFALTDQPFDDGFKEVSTSDYYKMQNEGAATKQYFTISEKVKPGKEAETYAVYHTKPDFYVTILSVEQ